MKTKQKTKSNKTAGAKAHIYNLIIIDESGSMCGLTQSTINGVNGTIQSIRDAQAKHPDTQIHYISIVTFDTTSFRPSVRTIIDCQPIAQVADFKAYAPNGCTPLYDAVGKSLTELHARIKDDPDASGVVTIITDGYENDSREWTLKSVKRLIDNLTKEGWSFSYMGADHDVKGVASSLSITNTVEFVHDEDGSDATWLRERSARQHYFDELDELYEANRHSPILFCAMIDRKRDLSRNYYSDRVTPSRIKRLKDGEVFVFGSNPEGIHSGGAARYAHKNFGAEMGRGEGHSGDSYAIPTTGDAQLLEQAVARFSDYATQHPETRFLVTAIGCGNAGYTPAQIAPMFRQCVTLENVALPSEFWDALGLKM